MASADQQDLFEDLKKQPNYEEQSKIPSGKHHHADDDGVSEGSCEPSAKALLLGAQQKSEVFYKDIIIKAFDFAEEVHRGQKRASGDPYIKHCVETALELASIGANTTLVAAGLLHDSIDDASLDYESICEKLGAKVADLVVGVSLLSYISELARINNIASNKNEAELLHTMLFTKEDIRPLIIKLADRLHNMKTLDALPQDKQKRIAKETQDIFGPLTSRLGISSWTGQMKTLCFKHLNPDKYNEVLSSSMLENSFDLITYGIQTLEDAFKKKSIAYKHIEGRRKSLYSIYCKMFNKDVKMNEIHDIHGIRVIVKKNKHCKIALKAVRELWPEVPGKFKDYINSPRENGYQSLHTVVKVKDQFLEVQIRTTDMHRHAELGSAAHYIYKEGNSAGRCWFVHKFVKWTRWMVSRQCKAIGKGLCLGSKRDDRKKPDYDGPVIIMIRENDKTSLLEVRGKTFEDLLVERDIKSNCLSEQLKARLNCQPLSDPTYKLKMGDLVEIDLTPGIPDK